MKIPHINSSPPFDPGLLPVAQNWQTSDEPSLERVASDRSNPAAVEIHRSVNDADQKVQTAALEAAVGPKRAAHEANKKRVERELRGVYNEDAEEEGSLLLRAISWGGTAFGVAASETWILHPMMGAFAESVIARWCVGWFFVILCGIAMKVAISSRHPPRSLLSKWPVRLAIALPALLAGASLVWFREVHYVVDGTARPGLAGKIMAAAVAPATATVAAFTALLTIMSAFAMERARRYFLQWRHTRKMQNLQKEADRIDRDLAVLAEEERCAKAQIEANCEKRGHVYMLEVARGRADGSERGKFWSFFQSLNWPTILGGLALVL